MINSINSYNTSFTGKVRFMQKTARKVVNLEKSSLKGISKTPIRFSTENEMENLSVLTSLSTVATSLFKSWMSIL